MIKRLPAILTLSLLASGAYAGTERASYQQQVSKQETAGFFSGALLGGLVGGPPGVVIGAALGAFTGDGVKARNEVGEIRADLYAAQLQTARLQDQAALRERQYQIALAEIERLQDSRPEAMAAYLPDGSGATAFDNTALTLHFRSGSSAIEAQYEAQLAGMVQLAGQIPTAVIEIIGYADRNGDASRNQRLSQARAQAVKEYFLEQGINNAAITTLAHGDNRPAHPAQSFETDFFDRRVIVSLRDSSLQMLGQNPDRD